MNYRISTSRLLSLLILFLFAIPSYVFANNLFLPAALTATELRQHFFDRTVETESAEGKEPQLLYFGPNGNFEKVAKNRLYKGKWKILKNGRLCTTIGTKKQKCRAVVNNANDLILIMVKKDGKHRHELTYKAFHPGNQIKKLNKSPLLPEGTLTSRQLKKLLSGHTVESVTVKKKRTSLTFYAPDGSIEQRRNGVTRTGTWKVKNSRICIQMENLKEKCRIIVKENNSYNKYIVKRNGHHQHSVSYITFVPGKNL